MLYIGSTHELAERIYFHKRRLVPGFTKKYNVDRLVYFEALSGMEAAIKREAQLKGIRRARKEALTMRLNPLWSDLCETVCEGQYKRV